MKTGFSRICVTPELGCSISGYYEKRSAKGVLDDLYVSTFVADDGKNKCAIIGVDTIHLSSKFCDSSRHEIERRTGINFNAIIINCSHTHTGPYVRGTVDTSANAEPSYERKLFDAIVESCVMAIEDLRDSTLYSANGRAENISFVRRFRMKNGNVQTNPGVDNPNVDKPLGEASDELKLIKAVRKEGGDIYLVNFGTHADTIGGEYISGDWPNFTRDTIEGAIPGAKCVFITGAQGDVNHINPFPSESDRIGLEYDTFDGVPRGYEHAKHMGRVVGGEVLKIAGKALPVSADKILFETIEIEIPTNSDNARYEEAKVIHENHIAGRDHLIPFEKMELTTVVAEARRIVELKDGPKSFFFTLSAIRMGGIVFAGTPGELFSEIGKKIRDESPFENTFVCCLTNGGVTYFPTSKAYDEGGYEARSSKLRKGGEEIIIAAMKTLFGRLK